MKKVIFIVPTFFIFTVLSSTLLNAEDIIFPNYSSQVSRLELDLELFDFAVNYINILSKGPLKYLSSISSQAFSKKKINCWVNVNPSIMDGTLAEKKKRLNDFCEALFIEYQKRFLMMDLDYSKKPGEVGQPALKIKPHNLKIIIHTSGHPSKFLAEWESGSMSYQEDFLSGY